MDSDDDEADDPPPPPDDDECGVYAQPVRRIAPDPVTQPPLRAADATSDGLVSSLAVAAPAVVPLNKRPTVPGICAAIARPPMAAVLSALEEVDHDDGVDDLDPFLDDDTEDEDTEGATFAVPRTMTYDGAAQACEAPDLAQDPAIHGMHVADVSIFQGIINRILPSFGCQEVGCQEVGQQQSAIPQLMQHPGLFKAGERPEPHPYTAADREEEEWLRRQTISGSVARMVAYSQWASVPPSEDVQGLRRSRRGRLVVTGVLDGGAADQAGVKAGDELKSIDGWKGFHGCPAETIHHCLKSPVLLVFVGFVGKLEAEVRVKHGTEPRWVPGLPGRDDVVAEADPRKARVHDRIVFTPAVDQTFHVASLDDMGAILDLSETDFRGQSVSVNVVSETHELRRLLADMHGDCCSPIYQVKPEDAIFSQSVVARLVVKPMGKPGSPRAISSRSRWMDHMLPMHVCDIAVRRKRTVAAPWEVLPSFSQDRYVGALINAGCYIMLSCCHVYMGLLWARTDTGLKVKVKLHSAAHNGLVSYPAGPLPVSLQHGGHHRLRLRELSNKLGNEQGFEWSHQEAQVLLVFEFSNPRLKAEDLRFEVLCDDVVLPCEAEEELGTTECTLAKAHVRRRLHVSAPEACNQKMYEELIHLCLEYAADGVDGRRFDHVIAIGPSEELVALGSSNPVNPYESWAPTKIYEDRGRQVLKSQFLKPGCHVIDRKKGQIIAANFFCSAIDRERTAGQGTSPEEVLSKVPGTAAFKIGSDGSVREYRDSRVYRLHSGSVIHPDPEETQWHHILASERAEFHAGSCRALCHAAPCSLFDAAV